MGEFIGSLIGLCVMLAFAAGAMWLLVHITPILIGIGVVVIVLLLIIGFIGFLFSDESSEKDKQKFIVTNDNFDDEEELPNTTMPNYYELLGVSKTASLDEIINAYEEKKAIIIDDYDTITNEKGKKLFEAFATLCDETSRIKYDEECRLYLHQNSGVYDNLVPMLKKNKHLYEKKANSLINTNDNVNNDILVDSEEESNKTYYNWKRALIIGFSVAIAHILFKYFAH